MLLAIRKFRYRFRSPLIRKRKVWFRNKYGKVSPVLPFILMLSIGICSFSVFENRMKPVINSFAQARAKSIATRVINLAVIEKLAEENINYQSFIHVDKDSSGNVGSIQTNVLDVNRFKSNLMLCMQDGINGINTQDIGIPVGNLFNSEILMGRGPRIPIKLLPVGDAEITLRNNLSSSGINQTKHEIILDVVTNIAIVMPMGNTTAQITTQIPVAETIIVGDVPNTYMNIESANKTSSDIGVELSPKINN